MKVQIVPEYVSLRTYKTYSRPYPVRLVHHDMKAAKTLTIAKIPCHKDWQLSIPKLRHARVYFRMKIIIDGKRVNYADIVAKGTPPLMKIPVGGGRKDIIKVNIMQDISYETIKGSACGYGRGMLSGIEVSE